MERVAVVGLGAMGSRVARRLLEAGNEVMVWNRTESRTAPLLEAGAKGAQNPADAASRSEAVITMVADPAALRQVTEGAEGIAAGADASTTVIEMSTVGPEALSWLASALPDGTRLLDAPVLGSLSEAEAGRLHVFIGGPARLVERWTPLLSELGTPLHVGPLGSGAAAKFVANSTLFPVLAALGESLALADALGLDREKTYAVLAGTPLGQQLRRRRPALESGDYPARFSLSLARKDAELIAEAAEAAGIDLRLAKAARAWFQEAHEGGWGERDYASVLSWILGQREPE